MLKLFKGRIDNVQEIPNFSKSFFIDPINNISIENPFYLPSFGDNFEKTKLIIIQTSEEILNLEIFNQNIIGEFIQIFCKKNGIPLGKILNPLRFLLIGEKVGPPIPAAIETFGKREFKRRIQVALAKLEHQIQRKNRNGTTTTIRITTKKRNGTKNLK